MNIEGAYQISIELSARKRVEGLLGTTRRLLGKVGAGDVPEPSDKEEHVQKVIALFKENEEAIRSISLEIFADRIVARSPEMEEVYRIKAKGENANGVVVLDLDSDELGRVQWDVVLCDGRYFGFESSDEMAEYVWEKV